MREKFQELAPSVPSPALWYKKYGTDELMLEKTPPEKRMLPREAQYINQETQQDEDDALVLAVGKENAAIQTLINVVKASTVRDQFTIAEWMQAQRDDAVAMYRGAGIADAQKMADVFMEKAGEIILEALKAEAIEPKAKKIRHSGNQDWQIQ